MEFQPILGKSTESYLGAETYFHNNINIDEWYLSEHVDTVQKLALLFGFWYSSDINKDKQPHDRIRVQNTFLMDMFGKLKRVTVQKALSKLEAMGIIERKFLNIDDELISKNDALGMTERRIILNPNKLKPLLTAVGNDEIKTLGFEPRSKERRFISRRPITIVDDLVKSIIKTQVLDVQARKNKISKVLLVKQFKQFKDFSKDKVDHVAASDNIISAFNFLIHQPPDAVDRYYVAK